MQRLKVLTLVLLMLLGSHDAARAKAEAKDASPFNPSGDYHPVDGSKRFAYFDLEVRRRKGRLVAWGDVRVVGARYEFASVSVTQERLKFTTVRMRGVSYSFDGRFLGAGDFPSQFTGHGLILLEGTLTKYQAGKKVAEVSSPFLYYPGC